MKKILCTGLVLLIIVAGITAAFAAGTDTDDAVPAAAEGNALTAATDAAVNTSDAGDAATDAAIDTTTGGAVTPSAVETTGSAVTSPAIETTEEAVTTTAPAVISADMNFTGDPVKLPLDKAYEKMLSDSAGAKMAELNKKSADGVAKGYGESVQNINQAKDKERESGDVNWNLDTSNKKMLEENKKYAAAQGPRNYQAEINGLKRDTFENYYTLKELENQLAIAKDNLALKEKLLSNTQLKYKLGTVSKSDVLQAETAVYQAKDGLTAAENGLNKMKMGFNIFMGYDLLQNVNLTDTIKEVPLSSKSLPASIKDALANRNEMFNAAYNLEMSKISLDNVKAYPHSSSTYIKANMAFLSAETGSRNAPLTVESDVRTKYMEMTAKYSAVQTGKKAVENAKETERLAQLQYDAGLATLSDVEGAQLAYYNEQLNYSKTLLQYNLAVNDYELASTVGTEANVIK